MDRLNPLSAYKAFVRSHPGLVQNAERLLHWVVWNPERFSSSEFAYEAFNAAVGLLGIYNDSILQDDQHADPAAQWSMWLAAVEQVQMLVELRGILLEQQGKMSRYSPLVLVELVKLLLRLRIWAASSTALLVEAPAPEDTDQGQRDQQLRELLQALVRLRQRYSSPPSAGTSAEPSACSSSSGGGSAGDQLLLSPAALAVPAAAAAEQRSRAAQGTDPAPAGVQQGQAVPEPVTAAADAASNQPEGGAASGAPSGGCGTRTQGWMPGWWLHSGGGSGSGARRRAGADHAPTPLPAAAGAGCLPGSIMPGNGALQPQTSTQKASTSSSSTWRERWSRAEQQQQEPEARGDQEQQQQQQQKPPVLDKAHQGSSASFVGWLPMGRNSRGLHSNPSSASSSGPQKQPCGGSSSGGRGGGRWSGDQQAQWIGEQVVSAGELLHLVRPLVYVLLLRKCGLKSWRPWTAALALDLLSMYGIATGKRISEEGCSRRWPPGSTLYSLALLRSLGTSGWRAGEQQELMLRRLQLVKYAIRSPVYEAATRRLLEGVLGRVSWVPGVGQLALFGFNLIEGMQQYYSYVEP